MHWSQKEHILNIWIEIQPAQVSKICIIRSLHKKFLVVHVFGIEYRQIFLFTSKHFLIKLASFLYLSSLGNLENSFQILENINGIYGRKNTGFCRSFLDFFSTTCIYFSQNVDEEKQHDWYKQMFKSLHKTGKKEGNQIWPRKLNAYIVMNWVSMVISKPI